VSCHGVLVKLTIRMCSKVPERSKCSCDQKSAPLPSDALVLSWLGHCTVTAFISASDLRECIVCSRHACKHWRDCRLGCKADCAAAASALPCIAVNRLQQTACQGWQNFNRGVAGCRCSCILPRTAPGSAEISAANQLSLSLLLLRFADTSF